ncbi:MAG TPA: TIGR01777 family oxidoreductase, partial [Lacipirellulaceae bacterium]|nr:TIGR01777 family oxidoreductase [Lacipirellulaceae bacterium]
TVIRAVRGAVSDSQRQMKWNADSGEIDAAKLQGAAAVVHLAGENIAARRWTADFKRRIRDSRIQGTRLIADAIARAADKPRALICASAIGYYGDRGDEQLTEDSPPGGDYLADVCREWEAACQPARDAGVRVVNARIGVVLSPDGGALAKMLTPFKLGAGGKLGDGRQYMSWIALDDVVAALAALAASPQYAGPVNLTAPHPVTNAEFTHKLGRVLRRPTLFPVRAFAARLAFGEMADALLLASTRVVPQALQNAGHTFQYPELEGALRHLLDRK